MFIEQLKTRYFLTKLQNYRFLVSINVNFKKYVEIMFAMEYAMEK